MKKYYFQVNPTIDFILFIFSLNLLKQPFLQQRFLNNICRSLISHPLHPYNSRFLCFLVVSMSV